MFTEMIELHLAYQPRDDGVSLCISMSVFSASCNSSVSKQPYTTPTFITQANPKYSKLVLKACHLSKHPTALKYHRNHVSPLFYSIFESSDLQSSRSSTKAHHGSVSYGHPSSAPSSEKKSSKKKDRKSSKSSKKKQNDTLFGVGSQFDE